MLPKGPNGKSLIKRLIAHRPALITMILCAGVLLGAGGCGSGDDGSTQGTSATGASTTAAPTKVTVGVIGIEPDASLYLGIKKGFFRDEHLDVVPKVVGSGSAITSGVISGDLQFGSSNPISVILAASKGLGLVVVAGQNVAPASPQDTDHIISGVVVPKDSPIRSARDLTGKTIAVPSLHNIGPVSIKAALQNQGIPIKGTRFIEMKFPDMLPALQGGKIDAANEVEPFVTLAKQAGDRVVLQNFVGAAPKLPLTVFFSSRSYANDHPDVAERFKKAMDRSSRYAANNPDEVRKIVPTYTKIPPKVAKIMALPVFTAQLSPQSVDKLVGFMKRYGLVTEAPDLDQLFGQTYPES